MEIVSRASLCVRSVRIRRREKTLSRYSFFVADYSCKADVYAFFFVFAKRETDNRVTGAERFDFYIIRLFCRETRIYVPCKEKKDSQLPRARADDLFAIYSTRTR